MMGKTGKKARAGFTAPASAIDTQKRFVATGLLALAGLTAFLIFVWLMALPSALDPAEEKLWQKVRAAQIELHAWRTRMSCSAEASADPWQTGFIGLEWSPLTTTLGDLSAKRTACDPAWAVWLKRRFEETGLKPGDRVAVFSSASFPGLILNSLAAAEAMGLKTMLVVSLGASTWGANHPACPWPVLEERLERGGFISGKAAFYTLGAGDELGHGLPDEALRVLRDAAAQRGVSLITAPDLAGVLKRKHGLVKEFAPSLMISIGGSRANLGEDEAVLKLHPGLIQPGSAPNPGNGLIAKALKDGVPVIHLLNLRKLSSQAGISYDRRPRPKGPGRMGLIWCGLGLLAYVVALLFHRRWRVITLHNE